MNSKAQLLFKQEAPITSPFGVIRNLGDGYLDRHDGVDYGVAYIPLYAPYDGEVLWEGYHQNGEIALWLLVDDMVIEFGHLSETIVSKGDLVVAGQQIAVTGNTGFSTGPHLHVSCFPKGQESIWPRQKDGVFKRSFIDFETWERIPAYVYVYQVGQKVQVKVDTPNMTQSLNGQIGGQLTKGHIDEIDQLSRHRNPSHPYHLKGADGWVDGNAITTDFIEPMPTKPIDGSWQDPVDQTVYPYFNYTVQEGDTLIALAQRFFGDESKWQWIYDFNNNIDYSIIGDEPRLNYIGRQIKIPHY